jgi:hypothetical protein
MENALVSDRNQFQNTNFGIWNKKVAGYQAMRTIAVKDIVRRIL